MCSGQRPVWSAERGSKRERVTPVGTAEIARFCSVTVVSQTHLNTSVPPSTKEFKRFQRRHLLIIGAPLTGTTLLATKINRHADIGVLNEDDGWAMRRLVGKHVVGNKRCIPNQIELKRRGFFKLRLWKNLGIMKEYQSSEFSIEDYLTLPEIKVIGIIRNGNDSISSGMRRGRKSFHGAAYRWCRAVEIMHILAKRHPEIVLIVSFEDLVMHPKENMQRVATFLSVDYQERMLEGPMFNPWYPEAGMNPEKVNRSAKEKVDFNIEQKFPAFHAQYLDLLAQSRTNPGMSADSAARAVSSR